jgi:hypothetical protein
MRIVALLLLTGCWVGEDGLPSVEADSAKNHGSLDRFGFGDTFFASGSFDQNGPFFQSLGTNGRTCGSCHLRDQGWTITPWGVRLRFLMSDGDGRTDPIFRTNDGSVSPNADVSTTAARRSAYAMLLSKALIRVGIGIPANAEFTLDAVDDPYGFASAAQLSLFRRPLPSTNLSFLSTVMWDGRETFNPSDLPGELTQQANDATLGHAQATGTDPAAMAGIVAFESQLYTAQTYDFIAGALDDPGDDNVGPVFGGPQNLANTPFFLGINDPLGKNPTGAPFDPVAMTMYASWASSTGTSAKQQRRASIARGEQIFNTRPIAITNVGGLNDVLGIATIPGTCTTCHDTPNVGDHSVPAPLNIGLTDESRRTPDLPLYTLRRISDGAIVKTTDPGRALITGKWADIGKFKGPILRGVAMRAPYFHNGSAPTLDDAVNFYDARFGIGLTAQDRADLVAFLGAL